MNTASLYSYYYNRGQGETAITEQQLLDHIMANFPPDLFIDPEQGITDVSGNNVTITQNGAPTQNISGGLNDRGYIAFDGIDDALIVNRVDIGTHAFVFRHNNISQMLLNVPTSDAGAGDTPKFFKQGFQWNNSGGYYCHLPDSEGGIRKSIRTHLAPGTSWRTFLCRGEGYAYNNGRSVFHSKLTALAETSVTKMFYGAWGRGDGTSLANFTQYDLGISMIWNNELTDEQMYIVNAYLEKRFDSFGALTYQYKPVSLEFEASNPVFDGNINSEDTQNQSYAGTVLPEGVAVYKGLTKDLYGFSSVDPNLVVWSDESVVLTSGGFGEFDAIGINLGLMFKENGTYNILYAGRGSGSIYNIGLATSTSPLSGYTKDAGNPVISISSVNTALSRAYTFIMPNSLVKIAGTYYLFCNALQSGSNACDIVLFTGASLTTLGGPRIILTQGDSPIKDKALFSSSIVRDDTNWPQFAAYVTLTGVFRHNGKYLGFFSVSNTFGDALTDERSEVMFAAIADNTNFNFKVIGSGLLIDTGGPNTWNKTQSYLGQILVNQDGEFVTPAVINDKWIIAFAGLGTTAEAINTHGMTGFAYAPKKLIEPVI